MLNRACGQLYQKVGIIRLNLCFVGSLVAHDLAAFFAFVHYYIAPFCIGERSYGAENSAAGICSVPRIYVNV